MCGSVDDCGLEVEVVGEGTWNVGRSYFEVVKSVTSTPDSVEDEMETVDDAVDEDPAEASS